MAFYMNGDYDLVNFFVVGDCLIDMELAKNLGVKGIWFNNQFDFGADEVEGDNWAVYEVIVFIIIDWGDIYCFLCLSEWIVKV